MIESIKELEKLLKLCRKQGVSKITFDNVQLELGDLPNVNASALDADDSYKDFPAGELTPEQLIYYSSGGLPKDDPALKSEVV